MATLVARWLPCSCPVAARWLPRYCPGWPVACRQAQVLLLRRPHVQYVLPCRAHHLGAAVLCSAFKLGHRTSCAACLPACQAAGLPACRPAGACQCWLSQPGAGCPQGGCIGGSGDASQPAPIALHPCMCIHHCLTLVTRAAGPPPPPPQFSGIQRIQRRPACQLGQVPRLPPPKNAKPGGQQQPGRRAAARLGQRQGLAGGLGWAAQGQGRGGQRPCRAAKATDAGCTILVVELKGSWSRCAAGGGSLHALLPHSPPTPTTMHTPCTHPPHPHHPFILQELESLALARCGLMGSLPHAWAAPDRFPRLHSM